LLYWNGALVFLRASRYPIRVSFEAEFSPNPILPEFGFGGNTKNSEQRESWQSSARNSKIGDTNMPVRTSAVHNDYRCSIDRNQSGKYCVRIQVHYPRHAWTLRVYFLASSFDRAMKKLEASLDFLQRHEEKLWFWGVDRAEDMGFSAEFLKDAGLRLDRRAEFPRKATNVSLAPEREVPAFVLGPMRRGLAESVETTREMSRSASAGD
jgi:hypothetical protein